MSNHLSMEKVHSIKQLHASGWSIRRIAKSLSIDRKTVKRYLQEAASKGTTSDLEAPTALTLVDEASKGASAPTAATLEHEPCKIISARSGCRAVHDVILQGVQQELTAQRIYQDLVNDHSFTGSYWSVNRYVKKLVKNGRTPISSNGKSAR